MTDGQWRSWLHDLMDGDAGPASKIIDATPGPLQGWATYDMPVVKKWHDGERMVIIGDAAHATSPAAGQGSSMSLEDAVVLAQCLRDCPDAPSAFRMFQALRQERVEKIVEIGHRSSSDKAAGPIMRILRDLILPGKFRAAAKDGGEAMMWLQGHHIDFEQRVTPDPHPSHPAAADRRA
jgi:2-polyprenyl-6-methoxyphenol hydroxylase-like FAD-dependent oxidoreductase